MFESRVVIKKLIPDKVISCLLILMVLAVCICGCGNAEKEKPVKKDIKNKIFGLTIDDAWEDEIALKDVVEGLKNLKERPTVRIVMSREKEPAEYVEMFKAIKPYADIMVCPVDSSEMKNFEDKESYLRRFKDSYDHLSEYVSIWEVGNEINGTEWIKQSPELIADKVFSAANFIKSKGEKIALTLYCTDSPQKDMIVWMQKYIPKQLADSVDYCFVSYYEDDNGGYSPDWKSIFNDIGEFFPSAFLGIGECGNTAENATEKSKIEMAKKYYCMQKYHKRFAGGYFWWNWVEDCIPYKNNRMYETISDCSTYITTNL